MHFIRSADFLAKLGSHPEDKWSRFLFPKKELMNKLMKEYIIKKIIKLSTTTYS